MCISSKRPVITSIVGESGSGKTTLARMILRLVEPTSGRIYIVDKDIFSLKGKQAISDFKKNVQPIFQNPFETFNPLKPVVQYLYNTAFNVGGAKTRKEAEEIIDKALDSVNLSLNSVRDKYPSQFSGGELQRISIARALISRPKLIVADEPVSMLDASLKINILNLFNEFKNVYGISFIYITHDLATAYYVSDYTGIMYRGSIVEFGPSEFIFDKPLHPYTKLLLSSTPQIKEKWISEIRLSSMEIEEFSLGGCKFALRCEEKENICDKEKPPKVSFNDGRIVNCFKYVEHRKINEV